LVNFTGIVKILNKNADLLLHFRDQKRILHVMKQKKVQNVAFSAVLGGLLILRPCGA
jgi:hypothetical protein